ncbi:MAG TPA: DUF4159 domain-containing protein [candidate division Zixibacteria bacterium]|nr:DUF4159 domain-containing protein [candidate division Zixibacteria bacterium]
MHPHEGQTNPRSRLRERALDPRPVIAILILALLTVALLSARGFGQGRLAANHPSGVSVARLHYTGGGDWYWGSSAVPNLLEFVRDNTNWPVDTLEGRVSVDEEELFDYPFLCATGHGVMRFSESDRERLRAYLNAGGFLFINDSYGMGPSVVEELAALFPDREPAELPFSHEIYHSFYDFPNGPPKIHEHDNKPPRGYGILLGDRVAVYFLLESDIGDGWEDSHVHNDPPDKRLAALQMGVNLLAYALTH